MRPLIGIPPCLDAAGRFGAGRAVQYLDVAYARAVADAGALPVQLPLPADPDALVARIDGLLLPGGGDFAPGEPGPEARLRLDPVPPEQLAFDGRLLDAALARGIPVLGICYGMQLLALRRGGRLVYDLPSELPGAGAHQLGRGDARHPIRIEPGSRLAACLGDGAQEVNSRHHQAVAEPGEGLRVCARAEDGVVEAIEGSAAGFCLGVQWHPESMPEPHRQRLFAAFVAACAGV